VEGDDPPFRVPPLTAVAGVLIKDWAEGRIGNASVGAGIDASGMLRGNL
jgi:NAD+ diphosphatase